VYQNSFFLNLHKKDIVEPIKVLSSGLYFPLFTSVIFTHASYFHTTLFADDINLHVSNPCFSVHQQLSTLKYVQLPTG